MVYILEKTTFFGFLIGRINRSLPRPPNKMPANGFENFISKKAMPVFRCRNALKMIEELSKNYL
jgi:hypothetical protein